MTKPSFVEALTSALAHFDAGRMADAEAMCRIVLEYEPQQLDALRILAVLAETRGADAAQEQLCRESLARNPGDSDSAYQLGMLLRSQGRIDEAESAFRRTLTILPSNADALNALGVIDRERGDLKAAEWWFRKSLSFAPQHAEALQNSGDVLHDQGRLTEAETTYRILLAHQPERADTHAALSATLLAVGRVEEALAACQEACRLSPEDPLLHSQLLCWMQFQPDATLAGLAAAHAQWQERHAAGLRSEWRAWDLSADPQRPVRVGFISARLGSPNDIPLAPVLENLEAGQFVLVGYADSDAENDAAQRIRTACREWRGVRTTQDAELAAMIRRDRIDILLDLDGHFNGQRQLCLARKPAPVQIAYLGDESPTGLETIDYVLSDAGHVPAGWDAQFHAQVLRLPFMHFCYEPPADAPGVSPRPCADNVPATFACLCDPARMNASAVFAWAQILHRLPGAGLLLQSPVFADGGVMQRFWQLFAVQGIPDSRIEILGPLDDRQRLELYGRIDVVLDPFPYGDRHLCCEALWMGVPVVALPREVPAGRGAGSILAQLGLADLAAHDVSQYVELAVRLAADRARLASLRGELRQRMVRAPLCDAARLAADVGHMLREVWRRRCADQAAAMQGRGEGGA